MKKQIAVLALSAMVFAVNAFASAQQAKKLPRIGYLSGGSLSPVRTEPFRQGLRELGYVEGKNIVIEWRSAEGKRDRAAAIATELVRLKVDVIVTTGSGDTRVVKEATSSIPIVMTQANDPVGSGFAASLARPGGNITGLSSFSPGVERKTTGASEGDRSRTVPHRRLRNFDQSRQCTSVKRYRNCRSGVRQ